jgi:GNAT superfamily N-acetyltransferase
MEFVNLELARRLEEAEARGMLACIARADRSDSEETPTSLFAHIEIMGGVAGFAGVDSPVTQAMGVGLHGAVTEAELDTLEEFFRVRGAAVNIEVCPMADMSLVEMLGKRGYRVTEYSDVMFRDIASDPDADALPRGVGIRKLGADESRLWSETVARGFAEYFAVTEEFVQVMEMFTRRPGVQCYLATVDGELAGGAALSVYRDIIGCFGAATLPPFRRRGVQSALLARRLADGRAAGGTVAMCVAQLNTASHRNIERNGFRVAYTRSKFTRVWG